MDDLTTTVILAILHCILLALALVLTHRPAVTLFHLWLFAMLLTWVIRPLLAVSEGGFMLYTALGSDWSAYNLGLLYSLIFNFCYICGYLALFRPPHLQRPQPANSVSTRSFVLSLILGFTAVFLIIVLSGTSWLPTERTTAITIAVPGGKFLFSLAVIPLSMSLPLGYMLYRRRRSRTLLILFIPTITTLSLLYQRGFALLGALVIILLYDRYSRLGYLKLSLLAIILLIITAFIRPFAIFIASGRGDTSGFATISNPKSFLLYGQNFDSPDVWPIVIHYLETNGPLSGTTFLATPLRVLPLSLRYSTNILTATDVVNYYYQGQVYFDTGFGFPVGLAQELFLNFGELSLVIGIIPGILTAMCDRWLMSIRVVDVSRVYLLGALIFAGGFTGELAGTLQWLAAFMAMGYIMRVADALRASPLVQTFALPSQTIVRHRE